MFDFENFEKELRAVLETSIVRNDPVASRIVGEFKFCRGAENVVGVLTQLYQRLDEIEKNIRSERGSKRVSKGISRGSRMNIRL